MSRTPEQVAADDALTAAIEGVSRAYGDGDTRGGVLTDYIVVGVEQWWDEDGAGGTTTLMLQRDDDSIPAYRVLGLLDYAVAYARAGLFDSEDDED